jgi:hypothetical protein
MTTSLRWPIATGRVVAGVLVSISAVFLAVTMLFLVLANRDLQRSQECRFDIAAEVNAITDRIDQATARGLAALAEDNDPGMREQVEVINEQTRLLGPAIDRRESAVEECK